MRTHEITLSSFSVFVVYCPFIVGWKFHKIIIVVVIEVNIFEIN